MRLIDYKGPAPATKAGQYLEEPARLTWTTQKPTTALTIKPKRKERARKSPACLELPKTEYLFTGTDNRGKKAYFFKMNITGPQDRIFGPYDNRDMAINYVNTGLDDVLESFCKVHDKGGMERIALPADLKLVSMR